MSEVHVHWQFGTLSAWAQVVIRTGDVAIKTCHELIPEVMPFNGRNGEAIMSIDGKEFHRRGILLR